MKLIALGVNIGNLNRGPPAREPMKARCARINRSLQRDGVDLRVATTSPRGKIIGTIISVDGKKRLGPMRWGFVSPTAKEPKLAPINARAETLSTSPLFPDAFRRHRCLVVADGFYEWRKNDGRRPFFIRPRSSGPRTK
jgi:putative SOS response-associated peptidase YedK